MTHRRFRNHTVRITFALTVVPLLVTMAPAHAGRVKGGGNTLPQISGTPATTVEAGGTYSFRPSASDAEGDTLRFRVGAKPAWAVFDSVTGTLSGRPGSADLGTYQGVTISVTDSRKGNNWVSLPAYTISVVAPVAANLPPRITGTPPTSVPAGNPYDFRPSASDPNGDPLSFRISNKPAWANFNASNGELSGLPGAGDAGVYSSIVIEASDGSTTAALPTFSIAVEAPANRAPLVTGTPATSVIAGQSYAFQPAASDPDGDTLTWSVANAPAWATFSTATGRLSGTPDATYAGLTFGGITVSVSDGQAATSLAPFSITVQTGNRAPVIGGTPATTASTGQAYAFQPTGSDPDGDTLTWSVANLPSWAQFSSSTGRISGTPSTAGTFGGITVSVSDGRLSSTLAAFTISVQSANRAPTITGNPPTSATTGQPYSFRPSASDADGDPLTYSIANKPAWASFSTTNGQLTGTPSSTDVGTTSNVVISVSDGKASANLPAFSVAVLQATNGSVTLSWTPPTTNSDGTPLVDLAGYRIVYGQTSRQYSAVLDIPATSVTSAMIENLVPATWYFAVKAYTRTGVESDLSNEASKTIL
ncbi:MAG: hypothetical protein EHM60_05390 [Lysobacterales bacterium]|nr:MAG: hypothetical protein EHM60_05390 [Xanthomonadales bacterium]